MTTDNALECVHLNMSYDDCKVLQGINLIVKSGQLVALLGPSGCGKTTLLRLIAGFERPASGAIMIKGRIVTNERHYVPAEERRVGIVFQEYALFPHLNVEGNIAFGLRGSGQEKQQRVEEMLQLVGLKTLGTRFPHELSGGQQQRIALARALAPHPDILLLDEPFSNLDAALRSQVRGEVRSILKKAGITCVFVTHDQEEALSLADEVALMLEGRIVQADTPQQIYLHPVNRAVASFVGEANLLRGEANGNTVACILGEFPTANLDYGKVDVLIRPESVHLDELADREIENTAEIVWQEFYGHDQRLGLTLPDGTLLIARLDSHRTFKDGQKVKVRVSTPVQVFPPPEHTFS